VEWQGALHQPLIPRLGDIPLLLLNVVVQVACGLVQAMLLHKTPVQGVVQNRKQPGFTRGKPYTRFSQNTRTFASTHINVYLQLRCLPASSNRLVHFRQLSENTDAWRTGPSLRGSEGFSAAAADGRQYHLRHSPARAHASPGGREERRKAFKRDVGGMKWHSTNNMWVRQYV
jgi:hypothetical protein